ncbi:MAG: hypothetical protein F4070_11500 [Acidimicrobiales bacterium]|nr:hypothetical protein [Acidimicrobiales bacterium]
MAQAQNGSSDEVLSYMRDMESRLHERLDRVDGDVAGLKTDMFEVKGDVAQLKTDMIEVKGNVAHLTEDVTLLKTDLTQVKVDVTQIKRVIGGTRIETQVVVDAVADLYGRQPGA